MSQRELRESITRTKEFMQLWLKFDQLYKEAMGKSTISYEEEQAFLDTKSVIARKFQTLIDSMSVDRVLIDHTYDVINQLLSLKGIGSLSEEALKRIDNEWHESYISINRLLGHLEAQLEMASRGDASEGKSVKQSAQKLIQYIAIIILLAAALYLIINIFRPSPQ